MDSATGTAPTVGWVVHPIGWVASGRREPVDDDWGQVESTITLAEGFGPEALAGLDTFSHVEVVYLFDRVDPEAVHRGLRVPRNNPAWPAVGIFAQRGKDRPNRLGVTICEVVRVEGPVVTVRGLDALDGTPVLDLKPHMAEFAPRGPVHQPAWAHEVMARYF